MPIFEYIKKALINEKIDAYAFIINIKDPHTLANIWGLISKKKSIKDLPMVIITYPKEARKEDQYDLIPTSKYEKLVHMIFMFDKLD